LKAHGLTDDIKQTRRKEGDYIKPPDSKLDRREMIDLVKKVKYEKRNGRA